jgi:hypothetical protein
MSSDLWKMEWCILVGLATLLKGRIRNAGHSPVSAIFRQPDRVSRRSIHQQSEASKIFRSLVTRAPEKGKIVFRPVDATKPYPLQELYRAPAAAFYR